MFRERLSSLLLVGPYIFHTGAGFRMKSFWQSSTTPGRLGLVLIVSTLLHNCVTKYLKYSYSYEDKTKYDRCKSTANDII